MLRFFTDRTSSVKDHGWVIKLSDVPPNTKCAVSGDGKIIMALSLSAPQGITLSVDGGTTWQLKGPYGSWDNGNMSLDGSTLILCGNVLYGTSKDYGSTWASSSNPDRWTSFKASDKGSVILALRGSSEYATTNLINRSTDNGVTWSIVGDRRPWTQVAITRDGTKAIATATSDQIYTSTDSGVTWVARDDVRNWSGCTISDNGLIMTASTMDDIPYMSVNGGVTWSKMTGTDTTSFGNLNISSCSADAKVMIGYKSTSLHISKDYGTTWINQALTENWNDAKVSNDGFTFVAVNNYNKIYVKKETFVSASIPPTAAPALGYTVAAVAPLPLSISNDNWQNALVLTGTSGTYTGNNAPATTDANIYQFSNGSVWFEFTPTVACTVTINTNGSSIYTKMSVFNSPLSASGVGYRGSANGGGPNGKNTFSWAASANQKCYIELGSQYSGATNRGNWKLNWNVV